MESVWARYRWLIVFTAAYLIAASFAYAGQGNKEFMGYLGVTAIAGAVVLWTIDHTNLDRLVLRWISAVPSGR